MPMTLLTVLVGIALLLFGRRLFWVFVAGVGFVCGALLAAEFLAGREGWVFLAAALAGGVAGAFLALFAQKLAVGVGGFLAGAYLAHVLADSLQIGAPAGWAWLIGGILGAILLVALFDWALIVLSSLTGAVAIVQELTWPVPATALTFALLLLLGLSFQSRQLRARKKPASSAKER